MGAAVLEVPGFEADDLLGSLAADGEREGYRVYVLTGIVTSSACNGKCLRNPFNKQRRYHLHPERFREEYGTEPARLVDIKL